MSDKSINNEILSFFANYIREQLGIIYTDFNYFQLQNRLEDLVRLTGCKDIEDLYLKAKKGFTSDVKQMVLDVATNNETSFFRDPKVFKALETIMLPQLIEGSSRPLKIWSAACSSGQEALSVSILLEEYSRRSQVAFAYKILCTDASSHILKKAVCGKYSQLEIQRGLPTTYLLKYFTKTNDSEWQAQPSILKNISHSTLNLATHFQMNEQFDLILCRNILIYQDLDNKKSIVGRILNHLSPQGFLVLGAGESLIGITNSCVTQSHDGALFYSRNRDIKQAV